MAIHELKQEEINAVSGGDITLGGPGLNLSVNPFALVGGLLDGVLGLVSSVLGSVTSLATGLLSTGTGLLGGLLGGILQN